MDVFIDYDIEMLWKCRHDIDKKSPYDCKDRHDKETLLFSRIVID